MDDVAVTCVRCGRTEAPPPATWSLHAERGQRTWLCDACTRDHVRSIEAKLDEAWW